MSFAAVLHAEPELPVVDDGYFLREEMGQASQALLQELDLNVPLPRARMDQEREERFAQPLLEREASGVSVGYAIERQSRAECL